MREFMEDLGIPLAIMFGVLLLAVMVIGIPVALAARGACASQAAKMDVPYSWGPLQDCMVQIDGKWILLDAYKVVKVRP